MLDAVLLFLATILLVLWWRSRPSNAPPSPGLALPVIGHMYLFRGDFMEGLEDTRRRLGNIFSLQIGPERSVVLNSYDLICEAQIKNHENLLERPHNFFNAELNANSGVVSLGGQKWKEQRVFLQAQLRALGMGRNAMAERIKVERDYLLSTIETSKGEPMDLSTIAMICVTNVIFGVTFGQTRSKDDKEILHWLSFQKRAVSLLAASGLINVFPWLKYIPGDPFKYKEIMSTTNKMRDTVSKWMDRSNRTVNVSDEAYEDVVQAYLTEIERKKLQGVTDTSLDEFNLVSSALELFTAGNDTTSSVLLFAVIYMVTFPHLQDKLYQEIKDAVGVERPPDASDRTKLKFMTAFIMETHRYTCVLPFAIDRLATKDFTVGGYTIHKGTVVKANYDAVLKDKDVWGDPELFRPERFLDSNGSVVQKKELIPFGVGKRSCLGESMANMELFIFISSLVQKFEFHPEKEGEMPDLVPNTGFSRAPKPFKVRAIPRKNRIE